jgi:uncharacterized protein (DUF305 family)
VGAPLLAVTAVTALVLGTLLGWMAFAPHHPDTDSPEAGFARDMSEHHIQAVEMSFLIIERAESQDARTLAYDIASSQANQIGQMEAWLRTWDLPTARSGAWMAEHPAHQGHDMAMTGEDAPPMPGMATAAEMQQLREADGERAEILFLQLMITHHISGVDMAQAAVDLSEHPEVDRIAQAMVNAQESEIDLMTDMLAARGAAPREEASATGHEDHDEATETSGP